MLPERWTALVFFSRRRGGTEEETGDLIDPSDLVDVEVVFDSIDLVDVEVVFDSIDLVDAGDAAVVNTVNWVKEVILTRQTGGL